MPQKLSIIQKCREITDLWIRRLPLPNINPSIISFLAIPFSLAFIILWDDNQTAAFIFLALTLITDWLDGILAKKHHRESEKGWVIDTVTDRLSEGIIFLKFFNPWFYVFLANIVLSLISYKSKKAILIPLRQVFFLYIIMKYTLHFFN
ncbi:CDP-alcohol phosphatidyltransferase family protein [Patescibacteria group bacterium]